MPKFL
jgi:hypothetical protein